MKPDEPAEEAEACTRKDNRTIAEALYMPGMEDIDFEPPRIDLKFRPVRFD